MNILQMQVLTIKILKFYCSAAAKQCMITAVDIAVLFSGYIYYQYYLFIV